MDKLLDLKKGRLFDTNEKYYRFQCDCLQPADAMDIGVMALGKEDEEKCITIIMHFSGAGFWDRIKYAWQIIRGHWDWRDFTVREADFKSLSDIFNPNKKFSELP